MRLTVLATLLLAPAVWLPAAPPEKAARPKLAMLGGTPSRNMVSPAGGDLSPQFPVSPEDPRVHVLGDRVRWKATLGSRAYGLTVAGDKAFVGTNNENPWNDRDRGGPTDDNPEGSPLDKGIVMCFRTSDGAFLWQMVHDKLESGQVNDWPREGVCCSPTVEGDRVYYTSNRCQVVCLDANGFADGNDGFPGEPYKDRTDGDVIWSYDMIKELKVFPHNMSISSPLIVGDLLYVITANGVDENHVKIHSPEAPSFVCLNKNTGKLIWASNLPGRAIMHGQWSSPAYGVFGGKPQVIFPGGDGWLYGLEPETGKLIWKFDCNPKDSVYELGGKGTRSDFIGMAVVYDGRVYIGTGQDPEHFDGIGHFWCINPAGKTGDVSPELVTDPKADPPKTRPNPNSAAVWHYGGDETRPYAKRDYVFGRTLSTACVVDGVVYISELAGYVHCLDARTGKKYWTYDTKSAIWGSCHYVAGNVLVANEDGDLHFFRHAPRPEEFDEVADGSRAAAAAAADPRLAGKDPMVVRRAARETYDAAAAATRQRFKDNCLLQKVEVGEAIRCSPLAMVGDTLYLSTEKTLFAIAAK